MATTVGERLKKAREALGYPGRRRAEFARQLGISPPSLHDLEKGESKIPAVETLYKLKAKGVNPDYIVKGESHPMLLKPDPDQEKKERELLSLLRELPAKMQTHVLEIVKGMVAVKPAGDGVDGNAPFVIPPEPDE